MLHPFPWCADGCRSQDKEHLNERPTTSADRDPGARDGQPGAAPYVGKLLADAGADVRKVESPAGEGIAFSRGLGRDSEIFVMHADGSEVYSTGQKGEHPDWGG